MSSRGTASDRVGSPGTGSGSLYFGPRVAQDTCCENRCPRLEPFCSSEVYAMDKPKGELLPPSVYVNFFQVSQRQSEFFLAFGQMAQERGTSAHLLSSMVTSPKPLPSPGTRLFGPLFVAKPCWGSPQLRFRASIGPKIHAPGSVRSSSATNSLNSVDSNCSESPTCSSQRLSVPTGRLRHEKNPPRLSR